MSGFDCEFVDKPPKYLQTDCPVCLLILCEPYQVTCCGKSFCKECIDNLKARSQSCPTCKQDKFESFPNKGLQQPLYGFDVFCSNKERGCVWEGELGQLNQHINSNPDKEKRLVGCAYTDIQCLFCNKLHLRHEVEHCPKRLFTCFMCEEYESTYEDVVNSHAPVCKCRPVECPNSCGADNMQHQHLEEHVSSKCPLTYAECLFSDAGCDAKVYRKDLASHLTDNLVTHMSLLAMENRKLKLQLQKQEEKATGESIKLKQQLERMESKFKKQSVDFELEHKFVLSALARVPPLNLLCPLGFVEDGGLWSSEPFYDRIGGDKLQVYLSKLQVMRYAFYVVRLASEFQVKPTPSVKKVTIVLVDQEDSQNETFHKEVIDKLPSCFSTSVCDLFRFCKNGHAIFRVTDVQY